MAKLSIASILVSGSAKAELQNKVADLIGARFGFRNNDKISCRTLQAVIDLAEYKRPLFDEHEIDSLRYATKATKAVVLGMLCEELKITDLQERNNIMTIATTGSEDSFVSQVLGMFV
ncbi:hypothetical protein WYMAN_214 [Vibrio phage Wyman]|nr:hypothetical protein WYMAN_12 [Vibrio phage Wyman]WBU76429.1 hypothetical protein WYMAN_214 [Vibrio phage Wyman]